MKKLNLMLMLMFIFANFSIAAELGEDQKGNCIDGVQSSRVSIAVDADIVDVDDSIEEDTTVISD